MKTSNKTTLKSYKTFLPIFTGFYNTIFEPCEDMGIEYINQEREKIGLEKVKFDQIQFDYKSYEIEVSKDACNHVEKVLNELNIKCIVTFEELISPREYNFTNDSINCTIEIDKKAVLKYLEDHKEQLIIYFKDKFTSCSGFTSFHSNNIAEWIEELKNDELKESTMGFILDAILLNEDSEAELNMYYSTTENMLNALNSDELTTK